LLNQKIDLQIQQLRSQAQGKQHLAWMHLCIFFWGGGADRIEPGFWMGAAVLWPV